MKYRVKFPCYWYNTGAADNHNYVNHEDFDTLEEAQAFRDKVDKQYDLLNRKIIYSWDKTPPTEYELKYKGTISKEELDAFMESDEFIEIENGFIEGPATIVKYYPEREESL